MKINIKKINILKLLTTMLMVMSFVFVGNLKINAAINPMVKFEGKVTNLDGSELPDGVYDFDFAIYNQPTGGAALWTENLTAANMFSGDISSATPNADSITYDYTGASATTTLRVGQYLYNDDTTEAALIIDFDTGAGTVTVASGSPLWTSGEVINNRPYVEGGVIDINLGAVSDLSTVDFNQQLYLQVTFDGEIMQPRKNVAAVYQSFESARLGGKGESEFAGLAEDETITGQWSFNNIVNIATTTNETALTITQNGYGKIVEFNTATGTAFAVFADGRVQIGNYYFPAAHGLPGYNLKTDLNGNIYWGPDLIGGGDSSGLWSSSTDITYGDLILESDVARKVVIGNNILTGPVSSQFEVQGLSWLDTVGLSAQNQLQFYDADSSNYFALRATGTLASNFVLTLPAGLGSAGQALLVNADGNLYWGNQTGAVYVNPGTVGQIPYYADDGSTLSATSTIFVSPSGNVGIGTTTPAQLLSVGRTSGSQFIVNTLGQVLGGTWQGGTIGVAYGGTGSTTLTGILKGNGVSGILTAIAGIDYLDPSAIGSTVQAFNSRLDAITGLATTSNLFLVANGTNWATQDPTTVRSTLGLTNAYDFQNYFITTAGNAGQLWMSDGTASGTWAATSTLGLLGASVTGSLGANYIPLWNGSAFVNSNIYDNTTNIGIGTTTPTLGLLDVNGHVAIENQNEIRMHELRANGTNYAAFRASSTLAANYTWTLPTTQGAAGDSLMVDEAGNLRWATASGTVSAFTDLSDVTITSALAGQVVYYNGSQWINTATGTLGLLGSSTIGTYVQGYDSDLNTIAGLTHSAGNNLFLVSNGTDWTTQTTSTARTSLGLTSAFDNAQYFITTAGNAGELWMSDGTASGTWAATSSLNIALANTTGTLPVNRGGTGTTTFNQYALVYASAANTISEVLPGAEGQVLVISGGRPTWAASATGSAHLLLSGAHGDTTANTVQRGDLITGQGVSATWSRLALGPSGSYITSSGAEVAWATTSLGVAYGGTGSTTLTGILKGNGVSGILTAIAGIDYLDPSAIGSTVQAFNSRLDAITGLATTSNLFLVANGTNWATQDPTTVRSTLGLTNAYDFQNYFITTAGNAGQLWMSDGTASGTWAATSTLGLLGASVTGSLGVSYIPRWNGSLLVNSNIYDTGSFVGIGTTTPAYILDVYGNSRVEGTLKIGAYTLPSTDGTIGQVLKTNGLGVLSWQTETTGGGSGTTGGWATSSNDLFTYTISNRLLNPYTVIIGGSATTSAGYQFEVIGDTLMDNLTMSGSLTITGNVDGYDISQFGPYFITSSGNNGELWMSDGTASGTWAATSTLNIALANTIGILPVNRGGTGTTTFSQYSLVYASAANTIGEITPGIDGQVLKIISGRPQWGADSTSGGSSGLWATTSDNLAIYPSTFSQVLIVGGQATTSTGYQFEVIGDTLMDNLTMSGSLTIAGNVDGYDISQFGPYFITSPGNAGQLWMSDGTASGTWAATSTLGLLGTSVTASLGANYVPLWNGLAFSNSNIYDNTTNIGIGTTTPTLGLLDVNGHIAIENQNELRMHELRANGSNYAAFRASSTLAANYTWTLPTTQGAAGDSLMVDEAGNLKWATASGTVSAFTDLSDVTITSALAGQVVYYNGSQWVNTATGTLGLLGSSTIGTYVQGYDSRLNAITGLATTSNLFLVANGANWATQDPATVRSTLGLTNAYDYQSYFITTAGSAGELWMSDGTASGTWAATSTLGFASSNISASLNSGYIPFWTAGNVFNNSALYYNGANFGIGTTTPTLGLLDVNGHIAIENQNELRMHELRANGTNYAAFRASSTLAANYIWTLPTTQGAAGDSLMVDEAGNLRWATASGTVSAFTDLSDVTITSALAGQVVYYNGSQWVNTATGTLGLLGSSTIGTYVQGYDSRLNAITGLATTSNLFLVANGTNWATQDPTTVRSTLGLTNAYDFQNYFITAAGNAGQLWMSDGTASGTWAATGTLGLLGANITGSLGASYIPRWNGSLLANSNIYDTGSFVGIGTTTPAYILDVYGNSRIEGSLKIGTYTLPATDGAAGQILKTNGAGVITWQYPDAVAGSGAAAGWATSTNDRFIYAVNTPFSNPYVVVIGGQATTSTGYQFEVIGDSLMDNITMSGSLTIAGTVDGYDISQFGPYFITSPGNAGELWMSDGTASGTWAATSTLGLLASSAIGVSVQGYDATLGAFANFNTNGLMLQTGPDTFTATSILSVAYGGTGTTTFQANSIIYSSATNTLSEILAGNNGYVLKMTGGVPVWQPDLTVGGEANLWATSSNNLMIHPSTISQVVVIGAASTSTTGRILEVAGNSLFGGSISAQSLSLVNALSVAYGGTGSATPSGILVGDGAGNIVSLANNSTDWNTAYSWGDHSTQNYFVKGVDIASVAMGGTGTTTFQANSLLFASAANTIGEIRPGTNGWALVMDNGTPTWSSTTPGSAHNILSGEHSDATATTTARGDLMSIDSSGKWNRLALGPDGYILRSNGTDASWMSTVNITSLGTITSGVWNGSPIDVAYGGTGATNATSARINLGLEDIEKFGITSTGTTGWLWQSDGDGRGQWIATTSLGIVGSGGYDTLVGTTTFTSNGSFSTSTLIGYQAANYQCNYEFPGSHFCRTHEILYTIQLKDITGWGNNISNAWIAEGPPGYTYDSNDCNGYATSSPVTLGAFWLFNSNGGGAGWLVNCSMAKSLACCKVQ